MIAKVSLLVVVALIQVNTVPAQNPKDLIQDMTSAQMWNPYSWMTPYLSVASQAWADYFNKAQEVSNQLYQQWDKTGAGNIFNIGIGTPKPEKEVNKAKEEAQNTADKTQEDAKNTADKTQEEAKSTTEKAQEEAKDSTAQPEGESNPPTTDKAQ